MKAKIITLIVTMVLLCTGSSFAQGFTIETLDGLYDTSTDTLIADDASTITWSLRLTSDANVYTGITNGFRIYSEDGANWGGVAADTLTTGWGGAGAYFDQFSIKYWSNDGMGADSVAFGGVKVFLGTGLPANFDEVAYSITIGPFASGVSGDHGKTVCLDSSWTPPAGVWKWAASGGITTIPSWGGPFCYTVVDPDLVLSVSAVGDNLPTKFALNQNYPNPFNPTTAINFDLPTKSKVSLKVYNVLGQLVTTLVDEELDAGSYETEWDASSTGSGVYFYKIEAGSFVETKKMMLLK